MTGKRTVAYSSCEDDSSDEDFLPEDASLRSGTGDGSIASSTSQEPRKKRGRGPSKRPCTNRNALMARVNRQRKKEYLESIETKLTYYKKANKNLASVVQQQGIDLKRLTAEVSYLRNILNNNTSITTLLRTMNDSLRQRRCKTTGDKIKWDSQKLEASPAPQQTPKTSSGASTGITCDPSCKGSDLVGNPNVINSTEDSQLGIDDVDIALTDFDTGIFDLNAEGTDGIDLFRSDQPDNLFDNLDSSGICLHVNSGRISLEYCSICHLNSINSDDP